MTVDVQNEPQSEQEDRVATAEEAGVETPELRDEIETLVALTKKVDKHNQAPCAACNILVDVRVNECPHCNSYIAPENALIRESLRRLAEIRGQLDGEHDDLKKSDVPVSDSLPLGKRIKRFFSSGGPEEESALTAADQLLPRFLDKVAEGDQLIIMEDHAPWYKIKTRDGKTGWVYSTLVREG